MKLVDATRTRRSNTPTNEFQSNLSEAIFVRLVKIMFAANSDISAPPPFGRTAKIHRGEGLSFPLP